MKDDRTKEEKYDQWVSDVLFCESKGWMCRDEYIFKSPSGTLHDLSAADLTKLDSIEKNGHFLV